MSAKQPGTKTLSATDDPDLGETRTGVKGSTTTTMKEYAEKGTKGSCRERPRTHARAHTHSSRRAHL